ncbi:MAG: hypothetical protein AAF899_07515 [Pseudomonadota bacterium]
MLQMLYRRGRPSRAEMTSGQDRGPWSVSLVALLGLAMLLGGCASGPTPYLAADPAEALSAGYTDAALEDNRFRITYTATARTPIELVEDYLLFRAAEVTLANGGDWFRLDSSETVPVVDYFGTAVAGPVFSTRLFVVQRFGKSVDDEALRHALTAAPAPEAADVTARLSGKRDMNNDNFSRRKKRPWLRPKRTSGAKGGKKKYSHHKGFKRKRHFSRSRRYKRRSFVSIGFGFPLFVGAYGYPFGAYYPYAGVPRARVTRLEAAAEIRVFSGERPEEADAFDARSVLSTIGPRLPLPEE